METLKRLIREAPDFPKPGILFYDITPLLRDAAGFRAAVDGIVEPYRDAAPDLVVGIESRGFIVGTAAADRLGVGFVPARKPGKLPWRTERATYALEYGTDAIEMHRDAVEPGQRVLIVDDLLATGGTARAAVDLVRRSGAQVAGLSFLIELEALDGRARLRGAQVDAVLRY